MTGGVQDPYLRGAHDRVPRHPALDARAALVVPRRHSRNLYEIHDTDLRAATLAAKRLAGRMRERLDCEGINLLNSSEPAANQEVFHFHIHVLPIWSVDGLRLPPRPDPPGQDELGRTAASLRG